MLPEFAIIGVASACCNPYTRCAQSVGLAIFVLNTVCPCLGCVNDMRFFKKVVQKISLNRLIHRKTWNTTENSLEKVRISAKTRWENVQGHKTGRSCNSYTILRVFFATLKKMGTPALYRHTDIRQLNDAAQPSPFRSEHSFLLPGCANSIHL